MQVLDRGATSGSHDDQAATGKVWPPRLIEVYQDGCWHKAQLVGYRREPDGVYARIMFPPDNRNRQHEPSWVSVRSVRRR